MARKNGTTGAVPNAGRLPDKIKTKKYAFHLTDEAVKVLENIPRMLKSEFVDNAIIEKSDCDLKPIS